MNFPALFSPLQIGPYRLQHRVVMAPLTRMRAERSSFAPREVNAEYYRQRATPGGLIIAEASPVMATGRGNAGTPGIYSEQQIKGWRAVVDAVHAKGGLIFLQLWHVGRVSHSSFQPGGVLPVAPSAVPIPDLMTMTAQGKPAPYETPRALETGEIAGVIDSFRQGAANALKAGFDGVEIHGANGYLIEQFLQSHTNLRTDQYGGSIANRARFLLEITQAAIEVWGANRVGVRLSPLRDRQWQRRSRSDAALQPCHHIARFPWLGLFAFHRAALERRRPRRGQPSERAVGDGAVQADLARSPDFGRRLHRRERRGGDCRRTGRRHRLRPHLHFQSGPAAPPPPRLSADAL
jgi:2,4-dienoyl-CoA reductase-like NADH-dependent reductase (Old Yellow Enzyme family)